MIKQYQLKNGMQVILLNSKKSPVISVQAWVKTGSIHEGPKEKGVTHFLEHLVFKGTKDYKVGEIAGLVEACGGEINAYTSFDQTVYYVTMPSHELPTGLKVISNMVGYPTLDPVEIDNERGVVIEEIKKGKDSLGRVAGQLLFSTAYPKHPLGIPVIGYDAVIEKIKPAEIRKYHAQHYYPKNVFLLVAGDFELPEAKQWIEESFGKIQAPKAKPKKVPALKVLKRPSSAIVKGEKTKFQQNLFYFSWRVPGPSHKDVPGLDVLAAILGQGDSSRLVDRLRLQEALALSVGSSLFTTQKQGLFLISTAFQTEKQDEVFAALKQEMMRVWKEGVTAEEIKKAVNVILSDEAYSLETVDGLARRYGSAFFYLNDLKADLKYKKKLLALTAKDLHTLAKKYLDPQGLIFSLTSSEDTSPDLKKANAWVKELRQEYKNLAKVKIPAKAASKIKHAKWVASKKEQDAELSFVKLPNGDRLIMRQDSSTPVISAKIVFLGGLRLEPSDKGGSVELLSRTWTSGTATKNETEISLALDEMASQIGPVSGRNSWGLSLDTLATFQERALDLYEDLFLNPSFEGGIISREAQVMIQQLKNRKDNPGQICGLNFVRKIFADHPCSRDFFGSSESIAKLQSEDLSGLLRQHREQHARHIVVCGNFNHALWEKRLTALSQSLGRAHNGHGEWQHLPKPGDLRGSKLVFEKLEKEQTHLIAGWRGLDLKDPRRYALHILQSVLAGQGGRLFIELRDKKSLAYSVSPMRMEGIDGGYFGAYIACSPEKLKTAIEGIKFEFGRLLNEKIPDTEIERAKRYLIGRHEIDLQRNASIAGGMVYNDVYGLDPMETFNYRERMLPVTADEIQTLAQELFGSEPILSVVGKEAPEGF